MQLSSPSPVIYPRNQAGGSPRDFPAETATHAHYIVSHNSYTEDNSSKLVLNCCSHSEERSEFKTRESLDRQTATVADASSSTNIV